MIQYQSLCLVFSQADRYVELTGKEAASLSEARENSNFSQAERYVELTGKEAASLSEARENSNFSQAERYVELTGKEAASLSEARENSNFSQAERYVELTGKEAASLSEARENSNFSQAERYVELTGKEAASLSEARENSNFSQADKSMAATATPTEIPTSTEAAITSFPVPVESAKQEKTEANRSVATTGTQTETPASTEAAVTTEPLPSELTMVKLSPSHSELGTEIPSLMTQSYSESEPQSGESEDDECDDVFPSQATSQIVAGNIKQTSSLAICHQSTSLGLSPDRPGLKSSSVTTAKPPPGATSHLRQRSFSTSSSTAGKGRRLSWGSYEKRICGETDSSAPERKRKTSLSPNMSPGGNGKAHVCFVDNSKEDSLEEGTSRMEQQHSILTSEPMKTGVATKKQRPTSATLPRNFRTTADNSPEQWRRPSDSNVAQRKRRMKRINSSPSALQPLLPIEDKAASTDEET